MDTPFVKALAVAGLGALLVACQRDDPEARTATATADVEILAGQVELEQQAVFAYNTAAASGRLPDAVLAVATKFRDQHQAHADAFAHAIEGAGGKVPVPKDEYPLTGPSGGPADLSTADGIIRFAAYLEDVAAKTYLSNVGKLSSGSLAQAAANVMGVEARHAAVLRAAAGANPIPAPFLDKQ
jgi:hypothetical protein